MWASLEPSLPAVWASHSLVKWIPVVGCNSMAHFGKCVKSLWPLAEVAQRQACSQGVGGCRNAGAEAPEPGSILNTPSTPTLSSSPVDTTCKHNWDFHFSPLTTSVYPAHHGSQPGQQQLLSSYPVIPSCPFVVLFQHDGQIGFAR